LVRGATSKHNAQDQERNGNNAARAHVGAIPAAGMKGDGVKEIARSNDPVRLSFLTALLADAGVTTFPLDTHASIMQGCLGVLPQRLMVVDDEFAAAVAVLREAGEWHEPDTAWPFG
jgi:hypothetical protein